MRLLLEKPTCPLHLHEVRVPAPALILLLGDLTLVRDLSIEERHVRVILAPERLLLIHVLAYSHHCILDDYVILHLLRFYFLSELLDIDGGTQIVRKLGDSPLCDLQNLLFVGRRGLFYWSYEEIGLGTTSLAADRISIV